MTKFDQRMNQGGVLFWVVTLAVTLSLWLALILVMGF